MRREFTPAAKFPEYNEAVDRGMVNSQILNGGSMLPNGHSTFWDEQNTKAVLMEIIGDQQGYYHQSGEKKMAKKPYLLSRLEMLDKQFERLKKDSLQMGYPMPTEMPREMKSEFYNLKAQLTVAEEEIKELRTRLKVYADQKQEKEEGKVLMYGLRGFCKTHGLRSGDPELCNRLAEIDYQKVSMNDEGFMFIDDKRSPYNGMLVTDYRKLAKQWWDELKKIQQEKLTRLNEERKAEGHPPLMESPWSTNCKFDKASLPVWPEWAKKCLVEKKSV